MKNKQKQINEPISKTPTSKFHYLTSNTAITLVALVITIIVLLILAGITLNMVIVDNGIIAKAQLAKEKTNQSQIEEENNLKNLENTLNEINTTRSGYNTCDLLAKFDSTGEKTITNIKQYSEFLILIENGNCYYNCIRLPVALYSTEKIYQPAHYAGDVRTAGLQFIDETTVKCTYITGLSNCCLYGLK